MTSQHEIPHRPAPTAGHYAWLAAGFLVLALYGSLVPFQFQPLSLEDAVERFRTIPYPSLGGSSRADWVANILLFIPLSFLIMATACVDRLRRIGFLAAILVIPCCPALSLAIEFLQVYFPPRTPSLNDVVAQSLGAVIGTVLWLSCGQAITYWLRQLWTRLATQGGAALLLPGYLFLLVLVHVMPLDLTISPAEVYRKYKEGRVHLLPFTTDYATPYEAVQKVFLTVLYFLPGGLLLAHLKAPIWGEARGWMRVLTLGLLLAASVEFLQLFVFTRGCDTTDIVVGGLSVLAGWAVGVAWRRRPAGMKLGVPRAVWFLVWLGVVLIFQWQPFHFTTDWGLVAERWSRISLVPFADMYQGTEYNAFDQVLHKTLLFLPLGVILTPRRAGTNRFLAGFGVILTALTVAVLGELGQLFLPDRFPSVSDILVETFAAWLGFAITCRLRFGPKPS